MNKFLYNLKESRIFQFIVISIIILNAITIGVNTYDLSELTKQAINYLDYSITVFFVIEIITSQAIAFSSPISPNFSTVLPFKLIRFLSKLIIKL